MSAGIMLPMHHKSRPGNDQTRPRMPAAAKALLPLDTLDALKSNAVAIAEIKRTG